MPEQIRLSLIQMNMEFCQPDRNYPHAEELIRTAAKDSDIVVLPELWNTGFFPRNQLAELSDLSGCRTKELMRGLAKELNVNIVAGSVASVVNGQIYNRAYIFNRRGQVVAQYDKTHLFTFMDEDRLFTAGNNATVFELDGVRCGILICYDIRFPELARTLALEGIEILFVVSQWPKERISHIEILSQARAIENQVYLAFVNSSATAGEIVYTGHSALINPLGAVLAQAGEDEEILRGTCDLELTPTIRKTINVYRDRRPEIYHIN